MLFNNATMLGLSGANISLTGLLIYLFIDLLISRSSIISIFISFDLDIIDDDFIGCVRLFDIVAGDTSLGVGSENVTLNIEPTNATNAIDITVNEKVKIKVSNGDRFRNPK